MIAQSFGLSVGIKTNPFAEQPEWNCHSVTFKHNCNQLITMKVNQFVTRWSKRCRRITHVVLSVGGSMTETILQNIRFVK